MKEKKLFFLAEKWGKAQNVPNNAKIRDIFIEKNYTNFLVDCKKNIKNNMLGLTLKKVIGWKYARLYMISSSELEDFLWIGPTGPIQS